MGNSDKGRSSDCFVSEPPHTFPDWKHKKGPTLACIPGLQSTRENLKTIGKGKGRPLFLSLGVSFSDLAVSEGGTHLVFHAGLSSLTLYGVRYQLLLAGSTIQASNQRPSQF